ncbi:MAG: hypothetical protein Q8K58_02555 [Acidimicrobiales bacterium]|nr:hypothetical protein [Acidimicrobiales bacterium]
MEAGDGWIVTGAQAWKVADHYARSDRDALEQEVVAMRGQIHAARVTEANYYVALFDASLALEDARLEVAEQLTQRALEVGTALGDPIVQNQYGAQLLAVRIAQGRGVELEPVIEMIAAAEPGIPWRLTLPAVLADAGRAQEAADELDRLMDGGIRDLKQDGNYQVFLLLLSSAAHVLRHERTAGWARDRLRPYRGVRFTGGVFAVTAGTGSAALGLAEATLGRFDDAEALLLEALDSDRRVRSRYWEARTGSWLAGVYALRGAVGDAERAAETAALARLIAEPAGLGSVLLHLGRHGL